MTKPLQQLKDDIEAKLEAMPVPSLIVFGTDEEKALNDRQRIEASSYREGLYYALNLVINAQKNEK